MCWSSAASLAFGIAGTGGAAYAEKRGQPRGISIPMLYFSLMEFLQFFSYFSLNECSLQSNSVLTLLSYIHIAFQPIFVVMFMMALSKKAMSPKARRLMYGVATFCTGLMLIRLVPIFPEALCAIGGTMCGRILCTTQGSWHLAWSVPQYVFPVPGDLYIYHAIGSFAVPLWYGMWRRVLLTILTGPLAGFLLAGGNPLEWPSIWCLYSSMVLVCIVFVLPRPKTA